jgi:hypothetical protein
MRFVEYLLLALLGSAPAAAPGATPGGPPATLPRTVTGDAVTQPSGGSEGSLGQQTVGSRDKRSGPGGNVRAAGTGRKGVHPQAATKHYKKGHRHAKKGRSEWIKASKKV